MKMDKTKVFLEKLRKQVSDEREKAIHKLEIEGGPEQIVKFARLSGRLRAVNNILGTYLHKGKDGFIEYVEDFRQKEYDYREKLLNDGWHRDTMREQTAQASGAYLLSNEVMKHLNESGLPA